MESGQEQGKTYIKACSNRDIRDLELRFDTVTHQPLVVPRKGTKDDECGRSIAPHFIVQRC